MHGTIMFASTGIYCYDIINNIVIIIIRASSAIYFSN